MTFRVGRQDFVMRTSRVRALLPMHEMIALETPVSAICGIISVGGRDCPVIDLSGKLGIPTGSPGRQPCVIIAKAGSLESPREFGVIADRISDVIKLRDRDFRDSSARVHGRMRRVFDPDILAGDENLWDAWQSAVVGRPVNL